LQQKIVCFSIYPFPKCCALKKRDYYILKHNTFRGKTLLDIQKKKPKTNEDEKTQSKKETHASSNSTIKLDQLAERTTPIMQTHTEVKVKKIPLVTIREYSSPTEITEKIDKEIDNTKSALGQYLRQLEETKVVAEKLRKLQDAIAKAAHKKLPKEKPNQIRIDGLEIVLDVTALHELDAIETVVRNRQQRLMALVKTKESLSSFGSLCETEGLKYLVLEKEGIPEQILLRTS